MAGFLGGLGELASWSSNNVRKWHDNPEYHQTRNSCGTNCDFGFSGKHTEAIRSVKLKTVSNIGFCKKQR